MDTLRPQRYPNRAEPRDHPQSTHRRLGRGPSHMEAAYQVMSCVRPARQQVLAEWFEQASHQIRDVQDSDQGAYMCQINTPAAKTKVGFLNVVGKADIAYKVTKY